MGRTFYELVAESVSPTRLLWLIIFFYFTITSGLIHDLINEPPAMGRAVDPKSGKIRPQAFMPFRINGQYIMEGICGGFFFVLGGTGFILLDVAQNVKRDRTTRSISRILGVIFIVGSFLATTSFLRIKIPDYLKLQN